MEDTDIHGVYRYLLARRSVCQGTDVQRLSLRAYFLTRSVGVAAQLSHRWTPGGQEIAKFLASSPWMLRVFLDCGLGRAYITTMFVKVLERRCVESFLHIIQFEPLATRFAARRCEDTYYTYVWTHYVPQMFGALLETYLGFDGLVIDGGVFLSIIPSLSPTQLETIMNHNQHRYLVYAMTSPLAYITSQLGTTDVFDSGMLVRRGVYQYENAERVWLNLRTQRRRRNWRFLFWCAVLHARMMEFRERYWSIDSSRVRSAATEFYDLAREQGEPSKN